MKVFISGDIEGVTGATHGDETTKKQADYSAFQEQMTAEVAAACEGALAAGAAEIWVRDAHASARNISASKLPLEAKLVRGWSGHPFSMVQELEASFAAAIMIGYHSPAGSNASPLAHTVSGRLAYIRINDRLSSEFLIHAYAASLVNVPVVFLSGDAGICEEAQALVSGITTVAVKHGSGSSTVSIHPDLALEKIRSGVQASLEGELSKCVIPLPERFSVEIGYKDHDEAYEAAFYPGASLKGTHAIRFETDDYFEVLRLMMFVI